MWGVIQAFTHRVPQYMNTLKLLYPEQELVCFSSVDQGELSGTNGMILVDLTGLDDDDIQALRGRGISMAYEIPEEAAMDLVARVNIRIKEHRKNLNYGDILVIDKLDDLYNKVTGRVLIILDNEVLLELRLRSVIVLYKIEQIFTTKFVT